MLNNINGLDDGVTAQLVRSPYRIARAVCLLKKPALLRKNSCGRVAATQQGFSAHKPKGRANISTPPKKVGTPVSSGPRTWVQTERKAHEDWGRLTMRSPRAAALMHHLVANMGHQNAVVIPQKTLAKLMGCSVDTIQRAIRELVKGRWIQRVQLGERGTVNAYVVNAAIAWGEKRDHIGRLAVFQAQVVADADDQPDPDALNRTSLRRLPIIYPPEEALSNGNGESGAQLSLSGLEPVIERSPPADKS